MRARTPACIGHRLGNGAPHRRAGRGGGCGIRRAVPDRGPTYSRSIAIHVGTREGFPDRASRPLTPARPLSLLASAQPGSPLTGAGAARAPADLRLGGTDVHMPRSFRPARGPLSYRCSGRRERPVTSCSGEGGAQGSLGDDRGLHNPPCSPEGHPATARRSVLEDWRGHGPVLGPSCPVVLQPGGPISRMALAAPRPPGRKLQRQHPHVVKMLGGATGCILRQAWRWGSPPGPGRMVPHQDPVPVAVRPNPQPEGAGSPSLPPGRHDGEAPAGTGRRPPARRVAGERPPPIRRTPGPPHAYSIPPRFTGSSACPFPSYPIAGSSGRREAPAPPPLPELIPGCRRCGSFGGGGCQANGRWVFLSPPVLGHCHCGGGREDRDSVLPAQPPRDGGGGDILELVGDTGPPPGTAASSAPGSVVRALTQLPQPRHRRVRTVPGKRKAHPQGSAGPAPAPPQLASPQDP